MKYFVKVNEHAKYLWLDLSKCLYYTDEWLSLNYSQHNILSLMEMYVKTHQRKYDWIWHLAQVLSLGEGGEGDEQVKCICVNPGRLSKGEGGGTFAELNYYGGPDTTNASIIGI